MTPSRLLAALVSLLLLPSAAASADAGGEVVSVHLVSRVGESGPATDRPKRARADEGVTLFAVLEVREGGTRELYADVSAVRLGGRRLRASPLEQAPPVLFFWQRVEPAEESLSNTASGSFRFEEIEYEETWIPRSPLEGSAPADVRPTLTPDRGGGVGTMRFKVSAVTLDGIFSTPGSEARRGRGSGGLTDEVHRVSLRRDDTYLGYLTELYGQPYIWASGGSRAATHQSERLEGADCADFVVYGRRRMGEDLSYTWTGALPEQTELIARGTPGDGGVYTDGEGRPIPFPRAGDLVLFPRHVGVLVEDRGAPGVLDGEDVMVHTYFETPREQSIETSAYADTWLEVRRW